MNNQILNQHQQLFPDLVNIITDMRVFHDQKLWKQLSESLLIYIKDPRLQEGSHLKDLYEGFVIRFYNEIDEMKLVRFLMRTANHYLDNRIEFLDQFPPKMDVQPGLVVKMLQAYYLLEQGQLEQVDEQLQKFKTQIERLQEVDPLLHSTLYYLAYNFYKLKQNYEEFYVNALQYLAYTSDEEITDKVKLSFEMALAVLISPNIYNFSELLQQPLLINLKQTQPWIYDFLEIFNRGDVQQFNYHLNQNAQQIQQIELLNKNNTHLQEKIRIMAFLELAFQLPKNNKICSFQDLAQVSQLDINQIERLVMRTISKGLVKGSINQVTQTITITYVVPRVLSIDKIQVMNKKFSQWEKSLNNFIGEVNKVKESFQ